MKKTFFIETFGCQMNKSDSELMAFSLAEQGFETADSTSAADIVIFNTCSVRQHAEDRVTARIKSAGKRIHKRKGIIVVAGCMAQRIGEKLIMDKTADLIIGPYQSPGIGEILKVFFNDENKNSYLSLDIKNFSGRINNRLARNLDEASFHKWVTITHGCENYCSYCIVPHVRGRLISFSSKAILDYISALTANRIKEVTLLGQNVNQYGMDTGDIAFHELLDETARIDGLVRVNFLTSHPKDFSENIINTMKNYKNISRSIHLPLQSGSDRILKSMNRQYTMRHYLKIIEKINKELSIFSISTDLIVGFPGETESDFEATLKAVRDIRFDQAFMYAYSPRNGTPAFNLKENLSREEKIERLNRLIETQRNISGEKLLKRVDQVENAIIERISKKSFTEVMGKTFLNHPVVIPGSKDDIGKAVKIKIQSIKGSTLYGTRIV